MYKIGILHPGEMGISIAASALNSRNQVYWASENRSETTRKRAEQHHLIELNSFAKLLTTSEVIVSVCPPHAAEDVAEQVATGGFKGIYLDANAISPERTKRIGDKLEASGIRFVDGSIIGPPAWKPGNTWLYLSGDEADLIAALFSNGPLETRVIGGEIGKASALKMCYAAYSKGTTALLSAVLAAAEDMQVREELYQHWERDEAGFAEQVNRRVARVTAKAWRFEGEMREIAATFAAAGLPDEFHLAAAEIYHRMANFKDTGTPPLDQVLEALLAK
jgi:3-hydroxyisobutyrate dehydrogenase-like beta-hydroxyacid dehydrogenase